MELEQAYEDMLMVEKGYQAMADNWFAYIVECSVGSLYTGITVDLERRVDTHNSGKGARYTRSRRPVKLVWSESHVTESSARKREAEIKSWSRSNKIKLIRY